MKAFIHALQSFLVRDDGDEYASRALKFMAVFVAEYGEAVTESGASHPIIDTFFREILEVNCIINSFIELLLNQHFLFFSDYG